MTQTSILRLIEGLANSALQFLGMEGAKLALGDLFAVLVVAGLVWAVLSAVVGNLLLATCSRRFGEERVYESLKYVVVGVGAATFYGCFYLYAVGF